jgi:DNA-binding TFAR19-related protein (PDSD5 family)
MYYVGCHQTDNLNDGYLGSGKYLKRAIKKYGSENFKFEILHLVNSKEEMFVLERCIVNESLVNNPLSYNLKIGGSGGNPGIVGAFKGKTHSEETKEKQRQAALKQIVSNETRQKLSMNNAMKNNPEIRKKVSQSLTGRTQSEEHRKRVAEANLGKMLVNNGISAKRISKEELVEYQNLGWSKGGLPRKKMSP